MQLPVPKGRFVTGAFCKNVVLKQLKAHFKRRRPKTGLKFLRLLQDNAPAHKARIVTEFLSLKISMFSHIPVFHLTSVPVIISCFPNSNYICLENDISQKMLLGLLYISTSWVCLFRTINGFLKIGLRA